MEVLKPCAPAAAGPEATPTSAAPPSPSARSGRVLAAILVVGTLVRLVLWQGFVELPPRIHDELDYDTLARNLVEHGEFAFRPGTPTSLRPPLYPALVALIYGLCGVGNYQAVRFVQLILSLINTVLAYRLGTVLYDRRVGLWLAGLFCFYPSLLGFNNLILTETLFTFFLTLFCYLAAVFFRDGGWSVLVPAGVVLGLGALTRSVLWLFPPVFVLYLLALGPVPFRKRLLAAAVLVSAFAVTLAPWAVRSSRLEKTFVAVDTMGGRNFLMGNYRHTPLYRSWEAVAIPGEKNWIHEVNAAFPNEPVQSQGLVDKRAMKLGVRFVLENLGLTLQRDVVKFFDFWGLERELVAGARQGLFGALPRWAVLVLAVLIPGSFVLALWVGVFGAVLVPPADVRQHSFVLLLIAFICGVHTVVFGHSRYHLPLMPLILAYTAAAVVHAAAIWQARRRPAFWLAAAVCAVFGVGWTWTTVVVDLDRLVQLFQS